MVVEWLLRWLEDYDEDRDNLHGEQRELGGGQALWWQMEAVGDENGEEGERWGDGFFLTVSSPFSLSSSLLLYNGRDRDKKRERERDNQIKRAEGEGDNDG